MEIKEMENMLTADYFAVSDKVWGLKTVFVNLYMVAINQTDWVLVDAGLHGHAHKIKAMATELFGSNNPPKAIILTHGHFDHVGNLEELLKEWNVPVYAHKLEMPYLTGLSSYPPPDPTVGGGLMSLLSFTYPKKPINLGSRVRPLQDDGTIPAMHGWIYVHTPGHAPGHISLFREKDRLLISGDAFVTTKQESAFSVALQTKILSGPPKYFTYNWVVAKASIYKLRKLRPAIAATGHGKPMSGKELTDGLENLLSNFEDLAVPGHGRYVNKPAKTDKKGLLYVPPKPVNKLFLASLIAVSAFVTLTIVRSIK